MARIIHKAIKNIVAPVIIFVIFILLFSKINLFELMKEIKKVNVNFVALAVGISIISSGFIGSDRLRQMLNILGCKVSFREAFFIKMGSLPLRMLPSTKLNLLSEILYLKRYKNFQIFSGLHIIILGLLLNIIAQLVFILIGSIFYVSLRDTSLAYVSKIIFYIPLITGFIVLLFFLLLKSKKTQEIILPIAKNIHTKLHDGLIKSITIYEQIDNKKLLYLWFYSVIFQFCELLVFYILSRGLHIIVPFYLIMVLVPATILISNLPISFNGIGIREATIFFLFSNYGTKEQILSLGIMYSLSEYIIPVLLGLLFIRPFLYKLL